MTERKLVVDHLKFSYEGLFNAEELFNVISAWFFEKGWDWYEKMNQEQITPDGKQIRIVLEPWKNISDFYKLIMNIKLNMIDVKEVEVEHEGRNLKLNQGLVRITFDAYVAGDRKDQWKDKTIYWFLGTILGKYFFREHFDKAEAWVKSDVDDLHNKIKNYLNVFKYTYHD